MEMSKIGGAGKMIVLIVLAIIIIGSIFLAYNYFSSEDAGTRTNQNPNVNQNTNQQQDAETTASAINEEKPPRPPE